MGRVYAVRGVARSLASSMLVLAAVGVVVPLRSSAQRTGYAWSHEDSRDGIELYTSDAPGHSYDAVRAVAVVDARPEILVAILRDIATFPRWYSRCKQTRVLQRPEATLPIRVTPDGRFIAIEGQESYVLYFLQGLPVVSDRWAIVRNTLRVGQRGELIIEFHSLDRYPYAAPADAVRMRVSGAWVLAPLSPARTRVSLTLDVDPMLSTPAFLVDPRLHDIAVETVAGLKGQALERKRTQLAPASAP